MYERIIRVSLQFLPTHSWTGADEERSGATSPVNETEMAQQSDRYPLFDSPRAHIREPFPYLLLSGRFRVERL